MPERTSVEKAIEIASILLISGRKRARIYALLANYFQTIRQIIQATIESEGGG